MAVKVINRKYSGLYRPNEETDWLLGNVGDWQKLKLQVEVSAEIIGSTSETISINTEEKTITLNSGKDWSAFGFDIGDNCVLRYRKTVTDTNQVETITEETIEFSIELLVADSIQYSGGADFSDLDYTLIPTDRGTERISNVRVYSEKEFEGVKMKYGHITNENFDTNNLRSFIDGTESEIAYVGFDSIVNDQWVNMELIGLQSGMSIRNARVKKIENPNNSSALKSNFTANSFGFNLETYNQTIFSTIRRFRERTARTFPLSLDTALQNHQSVNSTAVIPFQDITTNSNYGFTNGNSNQMFIFNLQNPLVQQYNFDLQFFITNTNEISPSDELSLVLYKYNNGTNLDFVERIVLKSWQNASAIIGQSLIYQHARTIFGNTGESFALALEFYHPMPSTNQQNRSVDIVSIPGDIGILEESNAFDFYKRFYEIEVDYLISSFFDTIEDLESLTFPDYLDGDGSLTDNFDIKFFPKWNNPNTIVRNILSDTRRLGNTGWFNENFNQLDNDFLVDSVVYRNSDDNVVDSLDYNQPTKVEVVVSGVQNLNQNTKCGFGFMWLPQDEEIYKENSNPFYRNTFVSNGKYDGSFSIGTAADPTEYTGAGIDGGSMSVKNILFKQENGNLVFTAEFIPNAQFAAYFNQLSETDRKYLLWLSVADSSATAVNFENRVTLLADLNDLIKTIPPAGPYDFTTKFIEHPFEENQIGVDVYDGIVQDDVLVRSRFSIASVDNIKFQQMRMVVEMENSLTEQRFELDSFPIDLSDAPIDPNGFQIFNVNQTRGFKLNDGNNKNFVKVLTEEQNSTNEQKTYVALFGFKIRYEDWIERANVPSDFFDANEENNGKNNDWFDYVNTPNSNWRLKFSIYTTAIKDDQLLVYRNPYDLSVKDYNSNSVVQTDTRYIRNSDNSVLNVGNDPETGAPLGVILENELTRIEMDFVIQDSGSWVLANTYGVTTIEIDRGGGIFEMRQLSSVWISESDNPLRPLDAETKLKLSVADNNKKLTTSCLVDASLLEDAVRYRITGRVGCFDDADVIDDGGIYGAEYESAYE